jgi:pimeloyl-ACP methyl ester carboxylesterase
LIGDKNKVSDELVSTLYNLIHEPKCNMAWESLQCYELGREKATTDLASHLKELKMPVLIVNGEKDSVVQVKSVIAASKVIEDCQLHIMKGCRHWAQKERPDEFVQVLKAFLAKDNFSAKEGINKKIQN